MKLPTTLLACAFLATVLPAAGAQDGNPGADRGIDPPPGGSNPPPAIADFRVDSHAENSITLAWTAPDDGDGGPVWAYDLRYSTVPFPTGGDPDAVWAWWWAHSTWVVGGIPPPGPPGSAETFPVLFLSPGTTYFFAILSWDEMYQSPISDTSGTTGVPDSGPPEAILDLTVRDATSSSIALQWTAPGGNPDGSGDIVEVSVRHRTDRPILSDADFDAATPAPGTAPAGIRGSTAVFAVTGLAPLTVHHFAAKSRDEHGGWSALSNPVAGSTRPEEESSTGGGGSSCGGSARPGAAAAAATAALSLVLLRMRG